MFGPCLIMQYLAYILSSFAIISLGEREREREKEIAGWVALH